MLDGSSPAAGGPKRALEPLRSAGPGRAPGHRGTGGGGVSHSDHPDDPTQRPAPDPGDPEDPGVSVGAGAGAGAGETGMPEGEGAGADGPRSAPSPDAPTVLTPGEPDASEAEATRAEETTGTDAPEDKTPPPAAETRADPEGGRRSPFDVDPGARTVLDDDPTRLGPEPPEPPPATPLEPGTVLFGEYRVEGLLGTGGMGEVYRAFHRRLGEPRAIKVLNPAFGLPEAAARLFEREARALLQVRHPAVVHCHDLLSDDRGRLYLVMELVEGVPLSERLARGPLPADEVRALGRRVAAGLDAAHARGVVHRDLSPDNILLPGGRSEDARIIDFGIAKDVGSEKTTVLEGFKGKLRWASPEQLGFFEGHIDGRSDAYSLGLVLAAAATGEPLDMGRTFAQAVDARRAFPGLPSGIPAPLRPLIEPLLALDPAERPAPLEPHFAGPSAEAGAAAATPAHAGLRWAPLAAGAALAVAAVAFVWWGRDAAPPAEPQAATATTAPAVRAEPEQAAAEPEPEPQQTAAARPPTARERAAALRRELRIEGLLRGADTALAEDRLSRPAGDNAVEKYRAVLQLDPGHAAARRGLERVGARYVELARAAIEGGEMERAETLIARAREVAPDLPELADARSALADARAATP